MRRRRISSCNQQERIDTIVSQNKNFQNTRVKCIKKVIKEFLFEIL